MTDRFPDHLATLVKDVRDDVTPRWDIAGIMKAIRDAVALGQPKAATACAAIRAADDPGNRTPAVIAMDGEHWRSDDAPRTQLPPRFLPGVDGAGRQHPEVARRGAAACREALADAETADAARREHELAQLLRRMRALVPGLSAAQRDRLAQACYAVADSEASS